MKMRTKMPSSEMYHKNEATCRLQAAMYASGGCPCPNVVRECVRDGADVMCLPVAELEDEQHPPQQEQDRPLGNGGWRDGPLLLYLVETGQVEAVEACLELGAREPDNTAAVPDSSSSSSSLSTTTTTETVRSIDFTGTNFFGQTVLHSLFSIEKACDAEHENEHSGGAGSGCTCRWCAYCRNSAALFHPCAEPLQAKDDPSMLALTAAAARESRTKMNGWFFPRRGCGRVQPGEGAGDDDERLTRLLRAIVYRVQTHPTDKIDWNQRDACGETLLTLAARHQVLSLVWPLIKEMPVFSDAVEPLSLQPTTAVPAGAAPEVALAMGRGDPNPEPDRAVAVAGAEDHPAGVVRRAVAWRWDWEALGGAAEEEEEGQYHASFALLPSSMIEANRATGVLWDWFQHHRHEWRRCRRCPSRRTLMAPQPPPQHDEDHQHLIDGGGQHARFSPFRHASREEMMRQCVSCGGADVLFSDGQLVLPGEGHCEPMLHTLICEGNVEVVEIWLEAAPPGAIDWSRLGLRSRTCLHCLYHPGVSRAARLSMLRAIVERHRRHRSSNPNGFSAATGADADAGRPFTRPTMEGKEVRDAAVGRIIACPPSNHPHHRNNHNSHSSATTTTETARRRNVKKEIDINDVREEVEDDHGRPVPEPEQEPVSDLGREKKSVSSARHDHTTSPTVSLSEETSSATAAMDSAVPPPQKALASDKKVPWGARDAYGNDFFSLVAAMQELSVVWPMVEEMFANATTHDDEPLLAHAGSSSGSATVFPVAGNSKGVHPTTHRSFLLSPVVWECDWATLSRAVRDTRFRLGRRTRVIPANRATAEAYRILHSLRFAAPGGEGVGWDTNRGVVGDSTLTHAGHEEKATAGRIFEEQDHRLYTTTTTTTTTHNSHNSGNDNNEVERVEATANFDCQTPPAMVAAASFPLRASIGGCNCSGGCDGGGSSCYAELRDWVRAGADVTQPLPRLRSLVPPSAVEAAAFFVHGSSSMMSSSSMAPLFIPHLSLLHMVVLYADSLEEPAACLRALLCTPQPLDFTQSWPPQQPQHQSRRTNTSRHTMTNTSHPGATASLPADSMEDIISPPGNRRLPVLLPAADAAGPRSQTGFHPESTCATTTTATTTMTRTRTTPTMRSPFAAMTLDPFPLALLQLPKAVRDAAPDLLEALLHVFLDRLEHPPPPLVPRAWTTSSACQQAPSTGRCCSSSSSSPPPRMTDEQEGSPVSRFTSGKDSYLSDRMDWNCKSPRSGMNFLSLAAAQGVLPLVWKVLKRRKVPHFSSLEDPCIARA